MKKIDLFFIGLMFSNLIFSQYPLVAPTSSVVSKVVFDTIYYKSGAVWKVIPYVNGKMNGEQTWYFENGNISTLINYKDNIKEGPWIEYFDYGYYKSCGFYANDARDSVWIENYYNKQIKSLGRYYPNINYLIVKDVNSVQYLFTMDSNLFSIDSMILTNEVIENLSNLYGDPITHSLGFPIEIHFKDNKWAYWDENGNVVKEEYWDKGKLLSVIDY